MELDENREIIGIEILEASNVVEHVPEYIEDLKDEARWNSSFAKTQEKFVAAARQVRKEIESERPNYAGDDEYLRSIQV